MEGLISVVGSGRMAVRIYRVKGVRLPMKSACLVATLVFALTFAAGRSEAVSIENSRLLFSFDEGGRLTRMLNKTSGQECYHGPGKRILKVLCLADGKIVEAPMSLVGSGVSSIRSGKLLSLRFEGEGITAKADISVRDDDPKTAWKLTVSNGGDREVVEVVFPDLDCMQIGGDAKDDVLVRPNRYGQKIPNPSENLLHKAGEIVDGMPYQEWWNQETLIYTGSAGMFWMDLYDSSGGVYLASEDKQLIGGYLTNAESGRIGMSLGKYLHVKKGQSFSLQYAVGVHEGDWHWGADRYREWAESFFSRPHIPRWVREMPNWYWRAMIWSLTVDRPRLKADFVFPDIDGKLLDGALWLGSSVVGLGGQEFMGHDYAFWQPDPTLGDVATLRQHVANAKRRGGYIVPYINPIYAWTDFPNGPHSDDPEYQRRFAQLPPESEAKRPNWSTQSSMVARRYDGTHNDVEQRYFGNAPQMCLADRDWQDYVLWWTHKYATDFGFSGVQWDQLGAYQSQYCTDWSHSHQHGGVGATGTLELCRRIYADPKYKVDPDFYIWYEGASDCISQYLQNCHAGYDGWMAYGYPELIRYTFPNNFYSGDWWDQPGIEGVAKVRVDRAVEASFLGRYKLGAGQEPPHAQKISKLVPTINAIKGIYWYTAYRDDVGCSAPDRVRVKVLEIDPKQCPYVSTSGFVLPYEDTRKDKTACAIRLSKRIYDLSGVRKVYWYPAHLQGLRREIAFDDSSPEYLSVRLPASDGLNAFDHKEAYSSADGTSSAVGAIVIAKQELHPMKVIAPLDATPGQDVVLRVVEQKIAGDGERVSASFGSTAFGNGLKQVDVADGMRRTAVKDGEECLSTYALKAGDSSYIYFKVDAPSLLNHEGVMEVKVRYFDEGTGTFRVEYNSSDPYAMPVHFGEIYQSHKGSAILHKQDTRTWKTVTFTLPDALLAGKQDGPADLRIDSMGGTDYITSVTVTGKLVKDIPVPNATIRVGNDKRTTDANGYIKYRFRRNDPIGTYIIETYRDGPDGYLPSRSLIRLSDGSRSR